MSISSSITPLAVYSITGRCMAQGAQFLAQRAQPRLLSKKVSAIVFYHVSENSIECISENGHSLKHPSTIGWLHEIPYVFIPHKEQCLKENPFKSVFTLLQMMGKDHFVSFLRLHYNLYSSPAIRKIFHLCSGGIIRICRIIIPVCN